MSTFANIKKKCSVCGFESEQIVLKSTNSFGPTDLDARPPSMHRQTMFHGLKNTPIADMLQETLKKKQQ